MKKLITKPALIIIFSVTAISLISFNSIRQDNHANDDILLVEIYFKSSLSGMFIFHGNKATEFIGLEFPTKNGILQNGKVIRENFAKLYKGGWELQSNCGSDECQRYFFKREK